MFHPFLDPEIAKGQMIKTKQCPLNLKLSSILQVTPAEVPDMSNIFCCSKAESVLTPS